ncbi:MAG: hypothetical protein FHK82_12885 [Sedimenticola thiotaurini]|uniref:Uncharacterized protein n=1 Tax=Sedimenticola thiotaurini TaxID=1543721 RepID=A0A558CVL1_9GAMM|nr:MAG: hypothetical protein FHK82_12885 [Sedimenticola thiotaurini]
MRKRRFLTLVSFAVLVYALYASVLLSAVPKYLVLFNGLNLATTEPEKTGDWLFYPLPRKLYLAYWEFSRFQECSYLFQDKKDSYVTFLSQSLLLNPKSVGVLLDKEQAKIILNRLIRQGCSVNEPSSETGILPIHVAVVFGDNDPQVAYLIAENGPDLNAQVPERGTPYSGKNAKEILSELLKKKPEDSTLIRMRTIFSRITRVGS